MTFLNLWGLFGFLGLLALIIIYILKPKYQDKTLSSTYIWKLSLKYRRLKTPFDWLKSSLLFILQVLIITTLAILMMKPNYLLNTVSGEKIVIIDASASMFKEDSRGSYFENAKSEIIKLAEKTTPKDRFTVIVANNNPVYAVRRADSIDYIKQNLTNLKPSYEAVDLSLSLDLVENVLRENPSAGVYLYTNKEVEVPSKIKVVDISVSNWNTGILDFKASLQSNGYYLFESEIINYGKNTSFALTLYVNGVYRQSKIINMFDGETKRIFFENHQVLTYEEAYITIDVNDGYKLDNEYRIYGQFGTPFKVQLYSENEDLSQSTIFFVRSALEALSKRFSIDVKTTEDDLETTDYDLYIYDTYIPNQLPTDGAIWVFNPVNNHSFLQLGVGSEIDGDFTVKANLSSTVAYRKIMNNIQTNSMQVTKYRQINSYPQFEKILSIDDNPILLTKDLDGQIINIFSFDLSYSNLPILVDFPFLIQNIFDYSIPSTVDKQFYLTGTKLNIVPKLGAYRIFISRDGVDTIYDNFPIDLDLKLPGTYTITQIFFDKADDVYSFFVKVPKSESFQTIDGGELILPHISSPKQQLSPDLVDLIPYLALGLFILLLIEWGVQYREQY